VKTEKFFIKGTENDGFKHRYEIKKDEKFKGAFINFMVCLGFDKYEVSEFFEDNKGYQLRINSFKDEVYSFKNKHYDIDVFYGDKKIIMLIRTKKRDEIIDCLGKNSYFIEPNNKKLKKRK